MGAPESAHAVAPPTLILSWADFDAAVKGLAIEMRQRVGGQFPAGTVITGPPRGGLCLAVALSHQLNLPFKWLPYTTEPVVWVDDVFETGETYFSARSWYRNLVAAGVWIYKFERDATGGTSRTLGAEGLIAHNACTRETWVVFPWEVVTSAAADRAAYYERRQQA